LDVRKGYERYGMEYEVRLKEDTEERMEVGRISRKGTR